MKAAGALILMLGLAGCMSAPKPQACPAGQAPLRTAQLFLGTKTPVAPADRDLRKFVDQEVTPRFPDGVTVVEGGGQWKGSENRMIREASKVVLVVLPSAGDSQGKVEAVRTAYRSRFKQDPVVVLPPPACVAL
ncbi:MAG: DUF3574 domain-containing protein [Alphaproteobacteria bacterium]|nr:DUF3574 domain-containing protein [Alphaproteobacteria bacterium]MBU1512666.1 DUF3574 domain-containing protein [Alphaproteobacteria bacterium]MBU2095060.1 DUF3574 domain-containing protein [Alphaproteobacteria bacterium]MBU2151821.1 DUF3574 domain-containing protein [Alphaproteobacteria bacterium]MBU2306220.1 DUF3574 domain-containing protein [Alphaproteobacteria bacterium]